MFVETISAKYNNLENKVSGMILKHSTDVPAEMIEKPGFSQMKARFLLTSKDGCPRYALRLMEIGPGGYTSYHCHHEEHEMFFLEGEGILIVEGESDSSVKSGDALFIPPKTHHQIKNTGTEMLKMICTVPILFGKTGKDTTPCE